MSGPTRIDWARAFIEQADLDLQLVRSLNNLVKTRDKNGILGAKPGLYCPAVFAYCQQSIEKALKAWLWFRTGSIPIKHNPLSSVLRAAQMKGSNRPVLLDIVDRNRGAIEKVLNMAPGAAEDTPHMETLLRQPNTEYPFLSRSGDRVVLPHEVIQVDPEVAAALKVASPLVTSIRKYLEVMGIWESRGSDPTRRTGEQ